MKVTRGYKTELDLNNEQRTACLKHAGAARFAYNWGLARAIAAYRTTGTRPNAIQNRKTTCQKLAKQHARVANIRRDATHKLTSHLCKNHALVAIEDLHVACMLKNHRLAQAVSDSNFGEIRRQLEYKASWHSVHLVVIDRFCPASKTCSACGWVDQDQALGDRVLVCQDCGLVIDRDLNAAINILKEALKTTGSFSESDASGQGSSGLINGSGETALEEGGTNHHVGPVLPV